MLTKKVGLKVSRSTSQVNDGCIVFTEVVNILHSYRWANLPLALLPVAPDYNLRRPLKVSNGLLASRGDHLNQGVASLP